MVSWKSLILLPIVILSFTGCLGLPESASSDELTPETASEDTFPEEGTEGSTEAADEFADFENPPAESQSQATQTAPEDPPAQTTEESIVAEERPMEQAPAEQITEPQAQDEFAEFEQKADAPIEPQNAAQNENTDLLLDEVPSGTTDAPMPEVVAAPLAPAEIPAESQNSTVSKIDDVDPFSTPEAVSANSSRQQGNMDLKIKSIQYKANDFGGAILIQADGPISFTSRNNPETEQLIVEIPGAELPDRLKRPFNMRDIRGAFGSLDPYQEKGSQVARFVVQLRPNMSEPVVVAEGDSLLIVADKTQVAAIKNPTGANGATSDANGISLSTSPERILTSRTLQEFLAENSKFYGKKVSIETNSMAVRDALRFISEEGGVNMVIADNVSGNVSLKLRDIPWDQAFVIIMKSKNLGYIRQGNVLRVATLADLQKEEEATIKLTTDRLKIEPLVVKVFPINYAKVDDLSSRIKEFLTERGKVAGDSRTSSIVVTDIQQSLNRLEQLIQSLDTQPPQVLIEGRIIEASDAFQRQVGINWGFEGVATTVGSSRQGDVTIRPRLDVANPSASGSSLGFTLGTLDIFGSLSATLSLAETENKIRILSSPRIVTLSNEKATIMQKIQRPYTSTTVTNGTVVTTTTFKDLDLLLDVTPQITSDASVIMAIKVKRDLVGEAVGENVAIESREANTKVMVKNGQTSVIGGVYQNDARVTNVGVPWLKDIPVIGRLFKFEETDNKKNELMIFLTPRIVSAGSDTFQNSISNSTTGSSKNAPTSTF